MPRRTSIWFEAKSTSLDRLTGKEGQQVGLPAATAAQAGESPIGVGNRPCFPVGMPAATEDGLDLRRALGVVEGDDLEPPRLSWRDLDGTGSFFAVDFASWLG